MASSGNEFDGSDFSNNLFSDLAPLLTLFGEQVTKQFLSQAMGYADDILLATVPLGILTCIVSAVRVGGRKWLKALVGRARESRAAAEMEIMSSTSDAVCELWSGAEIVRERGQPKTKEFIYRPVTDRTNLAEVLDSKIVYDLRTACEDGVLTIKKTSSTLKRLLYSHNSDAMPLIHERKRAAEYATRLMQQAPNLTLNVTKAITSPVAIWSFASLGILIQLGVFVIASLVTYHWQLGERGSSSVVGYGFPLFLSGSILLCAGIFLCSYIIEAMTEEVDFDLVAHDKETKVVRIQCACTVGDQKYDSYAIRNEEGNTTIRTSRINGDPDFSFLSIVATSLSLSGYIMQFVGLRAMHWSVAITVLGATLIMACIRAYVRRGLAADPQVKKLHEGRELAWMAMDALGLRSFELGTPTPTEGVGNYEKSENAALNGLNDESTTSKTQTTGSRLARKAVEVHKELTKLVPWQDESLTLAHQLAEAISLTLLYFLNSKHLELNEIGKSTLLFEETPKRQTPTEEQDGSQGGPSRKPLLSARLISPEEYKTSEDEPSTKERFMVRARYKKPAADEEMLNEEIVQVPSLERSSVAEATMTRAVPHTIPAFSKVKAQSDQYGTGNWFWENRDSVEEAASSIEPQIPPGFIYLAFQDANKIFGLNFKWEFDVRLSGLSVEGLSTAKYGFSTRAIVQVSEVREVDRRKLSRLSDDDSEIHSSVSETASWTTDVRSLAAIISLWTLTIEENLGTDALPPEPVRLLGCGWQVPVPATLFVTAKNKNQTKVRQWIESNCKDGSESEESILRVEASDNDDPVIPDQEGDTALAASIPDEDPEAEHNPVRFGDTVHEFKLVDFYGVWIERMTPAIRGADLESRLKDDCYIFGTSLAYYSRRLRLEALEVKDSQADNADSTKTPSGESPRRTPDKISTLLSYLSPPNGVILDGDDSLKSSLNEVTAVRTRTSIPRLCAQEIFSAFMLQLVALLREVKGGAASRTSYRAYNVDPEDTLRWRHPGLSQLASIVRESNLASDEEEAYMLIIPAFHAHGLLPTAEDGASELSESYSYYSSYYTSYSYGSQASRPATWSSRRAENAQSAEV